MHREAVVAYPQTQRQDSLAEDAVSSELLSDEVDLMAAWSFGHDIG
jgi:hypothetical protein